MVGRHLLGWIDSYSASDNPTAAAAPRSPLAAGQNTFTEGASLLPHALRTGGVEFGPGEHPFPFKCEIRRPTIRIEPAIYLDALLRDVLLFDGRLVIRKFESRFDLMSLPEPLIVNCTGLGA